MAQDSRLRTQVKELLRFEESQTNIVNIRDGLLYWNCKNIMSGVNDALDIIF